MPHGEGETITKLLFEKTLAEEEDHRDVFSSLIEEA